MAIVRCIIEHPALEGILEPDEIVELESITDSDGNYLDYKFKNKHGHYFTGTGITNRIGNKLLFDIFEKL